MTDTNAETADRGDRRAAEYVVVARRYRPQDFTSLLGQDHVAQGLANAIQTNRVGHAYLFTGARGVGKTSTARIFAKALNCQQGPTTSPCGTCDVCQGIASGDDVDVLEIDGASNRGIDEIRQLRQNVGIRPSRARFKIYIIDEVHMLTVPAFNALLKTLEEPPEHVKFIFCTTEADKIPITVLSRCQRFDFAPMELGSIVSRLEFIVQNEGIAAEPEALQLVARRAAGSMRDSQSLLEQLMSFGGERITAADVHAMLGTADSGRLTALAQAVLARNAAAALQLLDQGVQEGVDVGQLVEQLLSYFRDLAAVHVGCGPELLLQASEADHAALKTLAEQLGLETILAGVQILDTTLVRMKQSTHVRILGELALVRLCNLGQLDQLATLVAQLRQLPATAFTARPARAPESSTPQAAIPSRSAVEARPAVEETSSGPESPPAVERRAQSPREAIPERALPQESSASPSGQQKKNEILSTPPAPRREPDSSLPAVTLEEAQGYWQKTLAELVGKGEMAGDFAKLGTLTAISAPNTLVVTFQQRYNYQKSSCERADRKSRLESLLSELAGRTLALEFRLGDNDVGPPVKATAPPAATLVQKAQRRREVERHPLVRQAQELFEAAVEHVTEPVLESHVTPDVVVTEDT